MQTMSEFEELKNDLKSLDKRIDGITENLITLNEQFKTQNTIIGKLEASLERLTVYIERTKENDRKIDTLFKKLDNIYANGTKNCPMNRQKIDDIEKRLDALNRYLIGLAITLITMFLGILVHLIDKHLF